MDKRQMRITWNENNWEKPSGHPWREEDQGKKNVPFENQFGYGHEEWLFNPRYRINGYQYGFVRGVENAKLNDEKIDKLYLYTKAPDNSYFLIGVLKDVKRIMNYDEELDKISSIISEFHNYSIEELREVNADFTRLNEELPKPILKFKWSDATILDEPIPVHIDQDKYKRYTPYHLTEELENAFNEESIKTPQLKFIEGKAKSTSTYTKKTKSGKRSVTSLHVEILNELYKLLVAKTNPSDISAEKSSVGGKIIDLLERIDDNKFNFYEIKTRNSGLSNIREALGQILEYALMDQKINPNKLIIIGPSELKPFENEYLNKLKVTISIPLEFWQYDIDKKEFIKT